MTEEYFNADKAPIEKEILPLDMDDMEELMEELDIESTDVPSETDVVDLFEDIGELSQDESFFEDLDDNEEVIAEIKDNPQPMNNIGVDAVEVDAIKQAMNANYLSEVLEDDELMGLLPNEVVTPIFVPEGEAQLSGTQLLLQNLESVIGDRATNLIAKIAKMNDGGLPDIVKMTPLTDVARIDILDDRDGRPRFIQLVDINGADVTSLLETVAKIPLNSDGEVEVQQVIDNSCFTNLENDSVNRYKADGMGLSIMGALKEFDKLIGEKENRQKRVNLLKWMRTLIFKLNDVFGFDDYKQLEALIAAWLMKNSTCRLSGIPGTGKTTVIECASTLLANSYGYHTSQTYAAGRQYITNLEGYADPSAFFGSNASSDNIYQPLTFDKGMYYDIKYNQKSYADVADVWESWRFTSWTQPSLDSSSNFDYTKPQPSGSYLYNFKFLRNQEEEVKTLRGDMLFPPVDSKKEVTVETYRALFSNCWTVRVPKDFDLGIWNDEGTNSYTDHQNWNPATTDYEDCEKEVYIKPIQILDANGNFVQFEQGTKPKYGPFEMSLRNAKANSTFYGQILGSIPEPARQNLILVAGMDGLYTDAGRNEGYWLREMMCHFLRDIRANKKTAGGLDAISMEMLGEIGVAKLDYDKRPDEVLYGLEIQSVEETSAITGATTNTFVFEPEPKPIVTQPIKFFNEANRSQSGVEDAILGLIAERKVEYRGKVFNSPPFVAWMDTNPHQKGNDLAFTDRIDMELLFRSVGLGGRYDQLMGKYGGGTGGGEPQLRIVQELTQNNRGTIIPMRIDDLMKVWTTVGKLGFTPPGSSYNGLRDIGMISMLFSQRFAKRPTSISAGSEEMEYSFATGIGDVHESPLLDYSITTNTETSGESTTTPLIGSEDADSILSFGEFGSSDDLSHVPSAFTRVLGFRFTNSIVKLAQAFSFLRGKEYVGRQDILDAVPYCLAHRLGRAKAGALDLQGNNKGLDGSSIKYVNEQEFLREVLVQGYIQNKGVTTGIGQEGQNLLDNFDLFYQRCRDVLASVPSVWQYEADILLPLHSEIRESSESSLSEITPVHWHIATMVMEEEKMATNTSGSSTKPQRSYSVENAGPDMSSKQLGDYNSMYSYFQNLILDPTGTDKEPILFDYYAVRGIIARDLNLFTNDRSRLLMMLDSEMRSISGGSILDSEISEVSGCTTGSILPMPQAVTPPPAGTRQAPRQNDFFGDANNAPNPRPNRMGWRTYFDSMGPYGILINRGQTTGLNGMVLGNSGSIASPLSADLATAVNNADQGLRVIGRYQVGSTRSGSRVEIGTVLNNFQKTFDQYVTGGHVFTNFGDAANMTMRSTSLEDWIKQASRALQQNIRDPVNAPEDDVVGCFVLKHAPTTTPQASNRGMHGEDTLRLWVRLQRAGDQAEAQPSASDDEYVTMLFTAGISSAIGTTQSDEKGQLLQGTQVYIVPADVTEQYHTMSFTDNNVWSGAFNTYMKELTKSLPTKQRIKAKACLVDTGNMSLQDRNFFNARFKDCLQ
tara:strand:+ start:15554 stop:20092 length:4539 start_codon:yes stop_codon:yes gene_type:complete